MKLRPKKPARENASRLLPRLARDFFETIDQALEGDIDSEQTHRLRILTKRFRYSLEYFLPCYGETMDVHVKTIRDLQQLLGQLNDCCSSRALCCDLLQVSERASRRKKLFAALLQREGQLLEQFRAEWRDRFQDQRFRKNLLRYLAHPVVPKPAAVDEVGPAAPRTRRLARRLPPEPETAVSEAPAGPVLAENAS